MNYVGELINHIDRQMSSTTQNNDQKEKAVNYIQKVEDILQNFVESRRRIKGWIHENLRQNN